MAAMDPLIKYYLYFCFAEKKPKKINSLVKRAIFGLKDEALKKKIRVLLAS